MLRIEKSIVAAMILSVLYSFVNFSINSKNISSKVIRLHVFANSDSLYDQIVKLKAKDDVQNFVENILSHVKTKEEVKKVFSDNLSNIQKIATKSIRSNGYKGEVLVGLSKMYFRTRAYKNVTLPAGVYDTLEVRIENGRGKNWWSVMFPSLSCETTSMRNTKDVFNKTEKKIICKNGQKYKISFKFLEIMCNIKNWFNKIFSK